MALLTLAVALLSTFGEALLSQRPAPVAFYFQHRREQERFVVPEPGGAIEPEALRALSRFVRCWRTDRTRRMNPRVVEIVAAVSRHYGDATIEVISGYRARPFGAPHSKHFIGRAMDIHIAGVPAKEVAAWVWQTYRGVGVGYYPRQQFVHIDVRDQDVRWIDTSPRGESAHARYFGRTRGELEVASEPQRAAPSASRDGVYRL